MKKKLVLLAILQNKFMSCSTSSATTCFDQSFFFWQLVRKYVISIDEGFTTHDMQQMFIVEQLVMDTVYEILVNLNQFQEVLIFDMTDPDDVFEVHNYSA